MSSSGMIIAHFLQRSSTVGTTSNKYHTPSWVPLYEYAVCSKRGQTIKTMDAGNTNASALREAPSWNQSHFD